MANPFRDMSVIMQALVAAAVAVVLVLVGVYVPGSPIARERDEVDRAVQQRTKLNQEVQQLSVYKQRYGELKQQMDALSKQLDTLKTIVPEEKEVDEFIRLLQGAASASNVQLRRLTSLAIVPKEYHYEMPFEVQADGPYFNVLDFFGRLGRLSRTRDFDHGSDARLAGAGSPVNAQQCEVRTAGRGSTGAARGQASSTGRDE